MFTEDGEIDEELGFCSNLLGKREIAIGYFQSAYSVYTKFPVESSYKRNGREGLGNDWLVIPSSLVFFQNMNIHSSETATESGIARRSCFGLLRLSNRGFTGYFISMED